MDPATPQIHWNLRHLWAFCKVAEHRSINRAASELHFSQPAISQGLVRLEADFGEDFFIRSPSGMQLTAMGQILLRRLRRGFGTLSKVIDIAGQNARSVAADPSLLLRTNQLAILVSLSRTPHLGECAVDLGISEKSVARHIRNLEQRLGISLVLRDGETVRLTQLGEFVARAAKIFGREIELAREEMSAEKGMSQGRLIVGALPLVRSFIVPTAMLKIAEANPKVRVQLVEAPYNALLSGVRDGEVDILVGAMRSEKPDDDIMQHPLFSERLCVVVRNGHPVLDRNPRCLDDLLDYPWIAPRQGSPARWQFDQLMQSANREPTVLIEVASHIAVRSVLLESDCLALISRHQIRYEEARGQLAVVPVELGQAPREVGYTVRSNWDPTPVQRAFLQELESAVSKSLGELAV